MSQPNLDRQDPQSAQSASNRSSTSDPSRSGPEETPGKYRTRKKPGRSWSKPKALGRYVGGLERRFLRTADLVAAREHIRLESPKSANALVFMSNILVQATLPHSNPGNEGLWSRFNGQASLYVRTGIEQNDDRTWQPVGLPYGSYPRLLLLWITTHVVKTGSRHIELGESLSGFMRSLGLQVTGGDWGTITNLREQMKRLFMAEIGMCWGEPPKQKYKRVFVAEELETNLWWDPVAGNEDGSLWNSTVTLSEGFVDLIRDRPVVPADNRILQEIKQSALALDLYLWLTYRVTRLSKPLVLSWKQVHDQFGAGYSDTKHFAAEARQKLREIRLLWPKLQYKTPRGRLKLLPSPPSVPTLPDNQ